MKRIEDDDDFMLEWLAPHEGPNYRIGTDVIIMTEPEDLKYVKESFKNDLIWIQSKGCTMHVNCHYLFHFISLVPVQSFELLLDLEIRLL